MLYILKITSLCFFRDLYFVHTPKQSKNCDYSQSFKKWMICEIAPYLNRRYIYDYCHLSFPLGDLFVGCFNGRCFSDVMFTCFRYRNNKNICLFTIVQCLSSGNFPLSTFFGLFNVNIIIRWIPGHDLHWSQCYLFCYFITTSLISHDTLNSVLFYW